jgi:hypothetical protein
MPANVFDKDLNHGQLYGTAKSTAVTVSGGPSLLPGVRLANRKDFLMYNSSTVTVFLGGSDVTTNNGIPVAAGTSFNMQAGAIQLYAVVSGTNQVVRVLEAS